MPQIIAELLCDQILKCVRMKTGSRNGRMRIRSSLYEKDELEFCSINMCPHKETTRFNVDLVAIQKLFERLDLCEFSNYEKREEGIHIENHLRIMGIFDGMVVMFNLYFTPTTFEEV